MSMVNDVFAHLESSDGKRLLNQERLLVDATERIAECMESHGITKSDLARRMGVSPARVTQFLRADKNLTLRSLADVFYAMGEEVSITPKPAVWRLKVIPLDDDQCCELAG